MKFSRAVEYPEMMMEVTWILTNLTSIDNSKYIDHLLNKKFGVIPYLNEMLRSETKKVRENALWGFSNLLADHQKVYDDIMKTDLLSVWNEEIENDKIWIANLRWIAWGLSNLWNFQKKELHVISFAIDAITTTIYTDDDEAVYDVWVALKALIRVEEEPHILYEKLNLVANSQMIGKIVDLIFTNNKCLHPLLSVLGNLLSFPHQIIEDQIFNSGFFTKSKDTKLNILINSTNKIMHSTDF